jgi:hypothetical protein
MSETLLCEGNMANTLAHRDGWYRTFKGYPSVNDGVWQMISGYKDEPQKMLLFFIEYVTMDYEYAGFLAREVMNGTWTG